MNISRAEREELNTLSKDVFGTSSRWQKLIKDGHSEVVMEEVEEYVPNAEDENKEGTTRKVKIPIKRTDGALQLVNKRYTLESVKEMMLERKKRMEEIRVLIAQQQQEAKDKQEKELLSKKVHEDLSGSAT